MAEESSTTASSTPNFTEAEIKFVLAALKNVKGGALDIDFDGLAAELGMKDAKSTRARWNTINRTKIQANAPPGGVDKASPARKNTKPKKAAGEDGDAEPKTPKKRASKKKAAAKAEEATPESEEAEANVKQEAQDGEEI